MVCNELLQVGGTLVFDDCGGTEGTNDGVNLWLTNCLSTYCEILFESRVFNSNGPRVFKKIK